MAATVLRHKHVRIDQAKLDKAKRVLEAGTDTEALDRALTLVVSEAEVYWFDDAGRGEVRVPRSWRILYRDGDQWKPVASVEPYGVAKDRYNKVAFKPVTTSALRLEVTLQQNWSAGIQEWKVK